MGEHAAARHEDPLLMRKGVVSAACGRAASRLHGVRPAV